MQPTVTATLRKALAELEAEKGALDRQIAAIRLLVGEGPSSTPVLRVVPKQRTMSTAARKAISQRMKEAWAKRRAAAKAKPKAAAVK
jgi:hypothetical protein